MTMNDQQWTTLISVVLGIVIGPGSYVAMKGLLPPDLSNQLIPVLVPLVMAGGAAVLGKLVHSSTSNTALVQAVNSGAVPGVFVAADTPANASVPQVIVDKAGVVKVDPTEPPAASPLPSV
jgi:hypothetical protein